MLRASALLSLELAEAALSADLELKDATPCNVLFQGGKPVFVDILSFRKFTGRPVWDAYHQCLRTFILPLFCLRDLGLRLDRVFLCDREGLSMDESYRLLGFMKRLQSPYRAMVTWPKLLSRLTRSWSMPSLESDIAKRLCTRRIRKLRRTVESCRRNAPNSSWTDYIADRTYQPAALTAKRRFIEEVMEAAGPGAWTLDLGANTGEFSLAAARRGHHVVAVDSDEACMDRLFTKVHEQNLDVLPLVMNLGRPTPSCGWGLKEQASFMERASCRFDLVLALALTHHLRFREWVNLAMQVELFWNLSRKNLVLEWVDPKDSMVQQLANQFGFLPEDYTKENLESSLSVYFHIRSRIGLEGGTRSLYWLEKQTQVENRPQAFHQA